MCFLVFFVCSGCVFALCFFFQAEDGIRDLVRSRGLGDVYKRQVLYWPVAWPALRFAAGVASALVFVYTSGWCLAQLLSLIHI